MNKCNLIGRLTRDPILRHTANGTAVTNINLAVARKVKQDDQNCDFIPVTIWGQTAEFACRNFLKGVQIGLAGRLICKSVEVDGLKKTVVEVVAEELYFADGKKDKPTSTMDSMPLDDNGFPWDIENDANYSG